MSSEQHQSDKNVWSRNLREERVRLDLTQEEVALALDVSTKSVSRWEANTPIPADKLAVLAERGMDVQYILTGRRAGLAAGGVGSRPPAATTAADEERALLACWRELAPPLRAAVRTLMAASCPRATAQDDSSPQADPGQQP